MEVNLTRRFANGFSASVGYTGSRIRNLETVHEFDREPYLWQPSVNGRPHRLSANWVVGAAVRQRQAVPEQRRRAGASLVGGWQTSGTFEYQPGALLEWGNIFFYGDLDDIASRQPDARSLVQHRRRLREGSGQGARPTSRSASSRSASTAFAVRTSRCSTSTSCGRSARAPADRAVPRRRHQRHNRDTFSNPTVNPTSTNFGRITTVNGSTMRFVTFVMKLNF